ncbi:MAG: ECF transporter S component [Erysipelotrichia bacterium]|nr:ECF transporter S component [Erysipelotrichia bacterium]NCC54974.1 ECF transporter S component [Erysipelotrichia bacterium]
MKQKNMKRFTLLALFIAIEIVIAIIPFLGYIPLGVINATTLHIPVIIAGILLGKKEGAILGFVFGMTSMLKSTLEPTATAFIFSPFITIGGISGGWQSVIIAFVPRILIGYLAGFIYETINKKTNNDAFSISIAALGGSMINTILVMSGIYFFFGHAYAQAINVSYDVIITFIMGVVASNGIAEAIVASIISVAVCKVGKKILHL